MSCSLLTALFLAAAPTPFFWPKPEVESTLVRVRFRSRPPIEVPDEERFFELVRAAFGQRRKSLANALAAGLAISAERARRQAEAAGIDPGRRAETLSLAEFSRLAAPSAGPDPA